MPVLLEMKNITKKFPGVKALDGVNLSVRAGTVHALMGENGAGKSTLMKCLFGIYEKDGGEILLDGVHVDFKNPREALDMGVAMVHQELNQALKRSVADNIWLGRYPTKWGLFVDERKMQRDTLKIFDELKISINPKSIMSTLPVAQRQMAEIAKAVSYHSKIIVLDEPTSSLSDEEAELLFSIIDLLKKRGCGIIYISHKMEEILRISDDITVMRDGRHVATRPASEMDMDTIIKLMVGRELSARFPERSNKPSEVIFKTEGLSSRHNHVKGVNLTLRRGEILGIAGLAGAGRTELLENIFGISERSEGRMWLYGREIFNRSSRDSIKNGFCLLTEERRASGILGILNIRENATVSALKKYVRPYGLIDDGERKKDTDWVIRTMNVKVVSQKTKIQTLSGGNQQKVLFGRGLLTEPEVFLLDEPTRGIDVGAKYEIYQLIARLAEKGKSVIVVSSEMPEILGICDRICVMSGGELVGEMPAKGATQEKIMALASKNV